MSSQLAAAAGVLELSNRDGGFLRDPKKNYRVTPNDVRVSPKLIQEFGLRGAESICGASSARGKRGSAELAEIVSRRILVHRKHDCQIRFETPPSRRTVLSDPAS